MENKVITVESIGLPTKRKEVSDRFVDQSFLVYGQTKIGKTKLLAQEEGSFFVMTERGHNHVNVIGVQEETYEDVMKTLNKLVQAKQINPYPYSLIVVDTFDRLIEFADEAVIQWARDKYKNAEVYSIGDVPNGAGWSQRTAFVQAVLRKLDELKGHSAVAVIMHETVDDLEDERGKYKKNTVNIGGKSNKAITGWADHTMAIKSLFVGDKMMRKIKLRPTRNLDAGSRGVLPPEIELVEDDKANWAKIRGFFK